MGSSEVHESSTAKPGAVHDVQAKMSVEVDGARRAGASPNAMYHPSSSEHLPAVTIEQEGSTHTVDIGRGNTFTVTPEKNFEPTEVVRQFDGRSGHLVSADYVQPSRETHQVFDPATGKQVSGTIVSDISGHSVEQDHFNNGVLLSGDITTAKMTEHDSYDAQGKIETAVQQFPRALANRFAEVRTTTFQPDGTQIVNSVVPHFLGYHQVRINRPNGSRSVVDFDALSGKPNQVANEDGKGNVQVLKIDEKTGKVIPAS